MHIYLLKPSRPHLPSGFSTITKIVQNDAKTLPNVENIGKFAFFVIINLWDALIKNRNPKALANRKICEGTHLIEKLALFE